MKLFLALGSGDIVSAHRWQMAGKPITFETSIIYSGQMMEFCRKQKIETLALSYHPRADRLRDGRLFIENYPRWGRGATGILYHLSILFYGFLLAVRARLFGADLAIIDSGTTHY